MNKVINNKKIKKLKNIRIVITNNMNNTEQKVNANDANDANDVNVVEVKKKKGRPKKNVEEVSKVDTNVQDKKKRGRKKKEQVVEEVKQKKKRGRKAAVKFFSSSIRKQIPLTTVLQDSNNFILHLDVKENQEESDELFEINNNIIGYEEGDENDIILSDFLESDNSIISDFIDNDSDLRDLYKDRLKFREKQDKLLISKLENFHNSLTDENCDVESNDKVVKNDDDQESRGVAGFFEILGKFINNTDWLYQTDVCCWWCCHKFDTVPLGLPVHYSESDKKFRVKGVFCSFSCLMAYKNDNPTKYTNDYLIKLLYKKITGELKLSSNIIMAPPRASLQMFGGKLTIEEFRNMSNENKILKMVEYPMFVSRDYIEEIDIKNVKNANAKLFNDIIDKTVVQNLDDKRIEDAKSRLQSQIDKTTVITGNTIDKFIKIT